MTDDITKIAKRALELHKQLPKKFGCGYSDGSGVSILTAMKAGKIEGIAQAGYGCGCCADTNEEKYEPLISGIAESRNLLPQLATAYLELKEKYDRLEKKLKYVTKAGQTALGMAAEMASQIDDLEGKEPK